ncbi:MAG: hypothetical protein P1U57_04405 [Oleibacter sp.]|nr:hypothetical protein [Thalassolituus sp.]
MTTTIGMTVRVVVTSGNYEVVDVKKLSVILRNKEKFKMKIIIDNRLESVCYYDGESMGGGDIDFLCSKCGEYVKHETIQFLMQSNRLDKEYKTELNDFFDTNSELLKGHKAYVGLLSCNYCGCEYAIYLGYGEVQPARYQASLISVAEI